MTAARILHEDDQVRVVHRPGGTDFTLVTFAALTERPNGTWIWASAPVEKLDLEAVGFIAKSENWYPASSMRAVAGVLAGILRPRSIGYGFSMGGYGVLKYGGMLGLTHGLAVSPQVSIDPADVPRDRRFHRFFQPHLHAGMRVRAGDAPRVTFVAGDPCWDLDAQHLLMAQEAGPVHLLPLYYHQHAAIGRFTSSALVRPILQLVLDDDAAGLADLLRQQRKHSAQAQMWVARTAESRGHGRFAARLWERARALGATPAQIHQVRAIGMRQRLFWLLARRRIADARSVIEATVAAQRADLRSLMLIGDELLRRSQAELAAISYRRAVAVSPRALQAQLGLLRALACFAAPEDLHQARARAMALMAHDAEAVRTLAAFDTQRH